jgi:hypothetical protein
MGRARCTKVKRLICLKDDDVTKHGLTELTGILEKRAVLMSIAANGFLTCNGQFSLLCILCSLLFCDIVLLCVTVSLLCIVLFIVLVLLCTVCL